MVLLTCVDPCNGSTSLFWFLVGCFGLNLQAHDLKRNLYDVDDGWSFLMNTVLRVVMKIENL